MKELYIEIRTYDGVNFEIEVNGKLSFGCASFGETLGECADRLKFLSDELKEDKERRRG